MPEEDTYPAAPEGSVRINKYLALCGFESRRAADKIIEEGRVEVNGQRVDTPGVRVLPTDFVKVDGHHVTPKAVETILLNKPRGYVCSREAQGAKGTVYDLLPPKCRHLNYAGRLDADSEGLLIFTNDGDLADKLMHPSYGATKIYHAFLDKNLKKADFDAILKGIELEDGEIHADSLSYVDDDLAQVGIQIHSGRNRIVRRIFEHLGYGVKKLDRVYFAGLTKKALTRGSWRFLNETEIAKLKMGSFE